MRKLNIARKKDPDLLPFTDKVINTIVRHKIYTFLDGFLGYHQISIAPEDQHKTTFVTDWGAFVWVVMPFGVKNGLPTYKRVLIKTFHEYIGVFMKIFLDDFTIFSDISTHLEKLKKCFLKCRKFGMSLNLEKNAFIMFLGTILGFIVSKEGKIMDPKKVEALVNMLILLPLKRSKFLTGWLNFISVLLKNLLQSCHLSLSCSKSLKSLNGLKNAKMFGRRLRIYIYIYI